jgi:hypothetical protein
MIDEVLQNRGGCPPRRVFPWGENHSLPEGDCTKPANGESKNRVDPAKKYIIDCIYFFRRFSKNKKTKKIARKIPHPKDGFSESINDGFVESRQNMISRFEE